ncbi:MAG: hypothetical protein VKM98_10010 [Cyanobacteriota bacterium]|nr:hypothetical protein [Cyanobacteriota bacterium]
MKQARTLAQLLAMANKTERSLAELLELDPERDEISAAEHRQLDAHYYRQRIWRQSQGPRI